MFSFVSEFNKRNRKYESNGNIQEWKWGNLPHDICAIKIVCYWLCLSLSSVKHITFQHLFGKCCSKQENWAQTWYLYILISNYLIHLTYIISVSMMGDKVALLYKCTVLFVTLWLELIYKSIMQHKQTKIHSTCFLYDSVCVETEFHQYHLFTVNLSFWVHFFIVFLSA